MKRIIAAQFRSGGLFRLFILFLLLCLISSCLQIDYYVTLNLDGTESVVAKIVAIKELKLDKMESQLKAHGYAVTRELRGDSVHLTATQIFPAGAWAIPYPYAMIKDSVKVSQSYNNYFLFKKYRLSVHYKLDSSKVANSFTDDTIPAGDKDDASTDKLVKKSDSLKNLSSTLFSIPMRYHIYVPGFIDTTTAGSVVVNTMNWNYKLEGGETTNILFASTSWNYTYVIILSLVTIAALFYVFTRNHKV